VVAFAELTNHRGRLVHGPGNEVGIFAVGRVPVTPVKDADRVLAEVWERFEEADEAMLIVDLRLLAFAANDWAVH
jgi:hypothetical protein